MQKEKSLNIFTFLVFLATLSAMGACYLDNTLLRLSSYISECWLIGFCLLKTIKSNNRIFSKISVVVVSVIVLLNTLLSSNSPVYTNLLKFFGYLCCYNYGNYLSKRYESLKVNNILLYSLVLIPVITVALFDHTLLKNAFFQTPNGFVFMGVSLGLFYALIKGYSRKVFCLSCIFVAFYISICSSLGVVVAATASFLLLNFKKSHLHYLVIGGVFLLLAIFYIDIPLFVRFRDVFTVWQSMTLDDWKNLQELSTYELSQRIDAVGERTDTTSSIWRIIHWAKIISAYFANILNIPFGLGAGYSVLWVGHAPHNDYLLLLAEYGIIVFLYFTKLVITSYKRLLKEGMLVYFIFTIFFYHLTENLVENFPPNVLFYFCLGWCMNKYKKPTTSTTQS